MKQRVQSRIDVSEPITQGRRRDELDRLFRKVNVRLDQSHEFSQRVARFAHVPGKLAVHHAARSAKLRVGLSANNACDRLSRRGIY